MGNTSSEGSSFTTDDSASESAASSMLHHARTPTGRHSRTSSFGGGSGVGLPTTPQASTPSVPQEPPEADLSHLTDEERAHIMSVLNRARGIQEREEQRVR